MKNNLHNFVGKSLFLLIFSTSAYCGSNSQALFFNNSNLKVEAGLSCGPSFFLGDLGGNRGKGTTFLKDLNLELTKMMKGAYFTLYPNKWLGLRLAADITYLEGRDDIINTNGIDELWRKQRNLDFKTTVIEAYGCLEVFPTLLFNNNSEYEPRLRPYGMLGLGIFHFDPMGSITDANGNKTWYHLPPLRTEGEGMAEYPNSKPYKLTQLNIPMGGGLKYYLSDRVNISGELLYRKTFTDYIDDVSKNYIDPRNYIKYLSSQDAVIATKISDKAIGIIYPGMTRYPPGTQRGDNKQGDAYFSVMFKIGIRFGTIESSSFLSREERQTKCPAFY